MNFCEFSGSSKQSKRPNDEKENAKNIFTVFKCLYPCRWYINIAHKFATQSRRPCAVQILSISVNKLHLSDSLSICICGKQSSIYDKYIYTWDNIYTNNILIRYVYILTCMYLNYIFYSPIISYLISLRV